MNKNFDKICDEIIKLNVESLGKIEIEPIYWETLGKLDSKTIFNMLTSTFSTSEKLIFDIKTEK